MVPFFYFAADPSSFFINRHTFSLSFIAQSGKMARLHLVSTIFVLFLLLVAPGNNICWYYAAISSQGGLQFAVMLTLFLCCLWNIEQRWGQWWRKQGPMSHRATASRGRVWGKQTVLLFAKLRDFMAVIAVGSVAVASVPKIVESLLGNPSGRW